MNLGFSEVAFILILALLLLGPKKLPEVGRQVGRAMAEFRRATGHFQAELVQAGRSLEAAVDVPRVGRQRIFEVVSSPVAEPVASAAEESHV
jgi:TatA/E family protein of Tat protein translocase